MEGPRKGTKLSYRLVAERPVRSSAFRLWIAIPFILTIGLILWIGVLSDSSGHLTMPGVGSIIYVAAVIAVTALLAYADRRRNASRKSGNVGGHKGHRDTAAR